MNSTHLVGDTNADADAQCEWTLTDVMMSKTAVTNGNRVHSH